MPSLAKNKKAYFEYEILDTVEAGLVLSGAEVKSIRSGNMKLAGGYISIFQDEAFLKGVHIGNYRYNGMRDDYEPTRERKLLLKRKEIAYLRGKMQEKGLTIVPLSVYTKGRRIKLEIGVARGKKLHDKRASIKKREQKREDARIMKERY